MIDAPPVYVTYAAYYYSFDAAMEIMQRALRQSTISAANMRRNVVSWGAMTPVQIARVALRRADRCPWCCLGRTPAGQCGCDREVAGQESSGYEADHRKVRSRGPPGRC